MHVIKKQSFAFFAVAALAFSAVIGYFSPHPVLAAGESYKWSISSDTIIASGGVFGSHYVAAQDYGTSYRGTYKDTTDVRDKGSNDYCAIGVVITLSGDNAGTVTISTPGPSSSNKPTPGYNCSDSIIKTLAYPATNTDGPITISGARPSTNPKSTPDNLSAIVYYNPAKKSSAPKSITITLKNSAGQNLASKTVGLKCLNVDGGDGAAPYTECSYTAYGPWSSAVIIGGTYSFCANVVATTCKSFTVATLSDSIELNKPIDIFAPESAADKTIDLTAGIPVQNLCVGTSVSSRPASLYNADGSKLIQTITLPGKTIKKGDPLSGPSDCEVSGAQSSIFLEGTFNNVTGSSTGVAYLVCLGDTATIDASTAADTTHCTKVNKISYAAATASINTLINGNDPQGHDSNPTCDTGGFGLNWIICPVYNTVADFSDWLFNNIVQPFLRTAPISTDPSNVNYKIWSQFRIIGNIFLVIALIVIVFGESIGGGLIDAYTAKKALPRVLVAAILINLSIYIVAFAVDITNVIGGGIGALMTAPLAGAGAFNIHPNYVAAGKVLGTTGIVAGGAAIAVGLGAIPSLGFILLFVVMPVVLGLLAAFVTLVLRKAIILALVLVSPVAFALYCLPNTEQYFRKWWDLLVKTLAVYPIVIVFFAVADILSVTVMNANGNSSGLALVISLLLQFLPLFFIPYAFRIAGGAIGRIHEGLTNFHKRGQEAIKGNANDPNSLRNRARRSYGARLTRRQQQIVDAGETSPGAPGYGSFRNRMRRGRSRVSGMFGNPDARTARYNKEMSEISEMMSGTGRDALRYAGGGYEIQAGSAAYDGSVSDHTRYFNARGEEINSNLFHRGKRLFGNTMSGIGSQLEYTTRKDQSSEMRDKMRFAFAQNAIAGNWNKKEMGDIWAQATYPHKDKWLSEWYSTPVPANGDTASGGVKFQDVGENIDSFDKMLQEGHSVTPGFGWSSRRAQDWHAINDRMVEIQQKITAGTATPEDLTRFAKISEDLDMMGRESGFARAQTGSDEVQVMSGTPEVQALVQTIFANRLYKASNLETSPGVYSAVDRKIEPVLNSAGNVKTGAVSPSSPIIARGVSPDRTSMRTNTVIN